MNDNEDHLRYQKGNKNMHKNKWQQKCNNPKSMEFSKSSAKREIHNNTILPQEIRERSNKQPNLTPKATRRKKKEQKKPKLVEQKKS